MNDDVELTSLLRALPPELPEPADRFERVRDRVRTRRRRQATVAAAAAVVVVAATPLAVRGLDGSGRAVDQPAGPPPSASMSPSSPSDRPLPGALVVTELGGPVSFTGTGTQSVALGARPEGATAVKISLGCVDPGKIYWPDGSNMICDDSDLVAPDADPSDLNYAVMDLDPGQTSLRIKADNGMSWRLAARYVHTERTPWGVNARGETFGVENEDGTPDLVAAIATNGRRGYVRRSDLNESEPTSPAEARALNTAYPDGRDIPVFESDGETQIGTFHIGGSSGGSR